MSMSIAASTSTDKIIVDKSRSHRNKAVSRTVRATRERLQTGSSVPSGFEREMLNLYIDSALHGAIAIPVLVTLIAAVGIYLSGNLGFVLWAVMTLSAHAVTLFFARKARREDISAEKVPVWRRRFLLGQVLMGLCWATFVAQDCASCGNVRFGFFEGTVLLVALAATAMGTFLLRNALLYTFAPVVAALAFASLTTGDVIYMGLTGVISLSLLFLVLMTDRMNRASVHILSVQSEKDDLIAELEVAKSMSDEARRRAEEANLAKSRFLASMSHELRTPLNAILGFSDILAGEYFGKLENDRQREYVALIHQSGSHLLSVVNTMLDVSKIEAGRYELLTEPFLVADSVKACEQMLGLQAREKGIKLTSRVPRAIGEAIADQRAIQQILINLVGNAIKFTDRGGIVTIDAAREGRDLLLTVSDTGIGIPADKLELIGQPFMQVQNEYTRKYEGTGLGLSLVKGLVALHGGSLVIESSPGEGTVIAIRVPADGSGAMRDGDVRHGAASTVEFPPRLAVAIETVYEPSNDGKDTQDERARQKTA